MAKFLPYGGIVYPSQGSTDIAELVKHFSSDDSFEELETQINDWFAVLSGATVINRPAIKSVSFDLTVLDEELNFFAQVHYILIGDADDSANI